MPVKAGLKFRPDLIKKWRTERGWSVDGFRDEMVKAGFKISHQTILNYESGKYAPDAVMLTEMAMVLGVAADEFWK